MYGQARLKPLSWATFVLGGRLSSFDTKTFNHLTGVTSSKYAVINTFTPYAGLVLNLSDTISAYGSYTSIFSPQSAVTYDGKLLPPVEGNQYEGGLTGTFFNKTLNARIAYFYTIRENTSLADPDHPGFSIAGGSARSRGFEAEMSGRVLPGWQIAASYAFTETLNLKAAVSQQGLPITTIKPRHLFKLWTKYTFQDGVLKDFSLGGGLRAQSSWYVQRGVRWRQPGLAIVDLQLGYRFSAHLDATLTVTNLLDKTYFQSMGTGGSGTYYGEPRNVMFTMRAKF
jgi:outer membrane receptor for ferric coprogen and ferric-rhodotorulic acid